MDEKDIYRSAASGIAWLRTQDINEVKDLSRSIQAMSLWNENTSFLIEKLLSCRKGTFWDTKTPLLDTARACSALAGCGIIQRKTLKWVREQQQKDSWNNDEIDTSYALIALGDAGIKDESGCEWLVRNYGKKWEHVGTTSLIITALLKHDKQKYMEFIKDRAGWIISKRESGGWTYTVTSNLALQALVMSGESDIEPTIQWLLGKQKKGGWGDVISTAVSLISLRLYYDLITKKMIADVGVDKLNSDLGN